MKADESEETVVYLTLEALYPFSKGHVIIKPLTTSKEEALKINEKVEPVEVPIKIKKKSKFLN